MTSLNGRPGVRRVSGLLLVAGLSASVLWMSTGTGCAGKRRAMKQRSAEAAVAGGDGAADSLDLASISRNRSTSDSIRSTLDAQDPSTWTSAPADPKQRRGTPIASSGGRPSEIYNEAPVVLDAPGSGGADDGSPPPRSAKRRAARGSGDDAAAAANDHANGAAPAGRERGPGQAAVNMPVQITPGLAVAPIDASGAAAAGIEPAGAARSRGALAGELALTLRGDASAAASYQEGVGLLALELIEPAAVSSAIAGYSQNLAPGESALFDSVRSLFQAIGSAGGTGGEAAFGSAAPEAWDASRLRRVLEAHVGDVSAAEPVSVRTAALCTSVDGYGRYTPYASTTFVHGRATPAIIYLALDHVTQRQPAGATPSSGGWSIDLVQSAKIYHDSDNLVVVDLGEQVVQDSSRDRRRDFCLARRIDLPRLSLGRYNLKVAVRDQASGATAEATIPIQIVADASLTVK